MFHRHPRVFVIAGLVLMVAGAIDPLEGSVVILLGSALAALGGVLGRAHHRRMAVWAFGLIAFGVAVMIGLSAVGGLGGRTGRSMWWALVLLPYPIGWVLGLAAAALTLRRRPAPGQ